jgi:hypothetical protein
MFLDVKRQDLTAAAAASDKLSDHVLALVTVLLVHDGSS